MLRLLLLCHGRRIALKDLIEMVPEEYHRQLFRKHRVAALENEIYTCKMPVTGLTVL